MNRYEATEFERRGVLHITGIGFENNTIIIKSRLDLKKPTKLDFLLAYITLTIPAAMLARFTRKLTGRKGTPVEKFCMGFYYDMNVKLLAKES